MEDLPVTVSFGKINLSNSAGTLASFKVEPPFRKSSAANSGKTSHAKRTYVPSTRHPDIGGGFSVQSVLHPEGTIIMIQGSRTRNRMRVADAVMFLRLRADAAFIVITARLPTGPESVLGDRHAAFQGTADIVTVDHLKSMDIEVPHPVRANYMNQEEIDELFSVQVIRPEKAPAPSLVRIATSQGVKTVAMATEGRRRLRVRRPS